MPEATCFAWRNNCSSGAVAIVSNLNVLTELSESFSNRVVTESLFATPNSAYLLALKRHLEERSRDVEGQVSPPEFCLLSSAR